MKRTLIILFLLFSLQPVLWGQETSIAPFPSSACGHETMSPSPSGEGRGEALPVKCDVNYNFVVSRDSLLLIRQQPEELLSEMPIDTFFLHQGDRIVVAEVRMLPADDIDSVWVQVARDQDTFGWTRESALLQKVVPDDPISFFIATFSNHHLQLILILLSIVILAVWIVSTFFAQHSTHNSSFFILHSSLSVLNSLGPYPLLLVLTVSLTSVYFASLKMFAPDMWEQFYFNPTLNPFSLPLPLGIFLALFWTTMVVGLATADDLRHRLSVSALLKTLLLLLVTCILACALFVVLTPCFLGYPLFLILLTAATSQYHRHRPRYVCGNCGAELRQKGKCPKCGADNH